MARMSWHRLLLAFALGCLAPLLVIRYGTPGAALAVPVAGYATRLAARSGRRGAAGSPRRRRTVTRSSQDRTGFAAPHRAGRHRGGHTAGALHPEEETR
ncbi:hypothetical protein [Nucisporomicrobium flavum]|uniref:hypothetical protein n=1 Tax=Nucisporomicrobium flavum TaxID=2785915 RepID=UPI0018F526CB|nr:hypothetical protein [Nucisporomicrobium flavum]